MRTGQSSRSRAQSTVLGISYNPIQLRRDSARERKRARSDVEVDTQSGALLESFCIVNFNVDGSSIALNRCISHNRHVYIAYWHTQFHRQLATFLRIQSAHGPKRSREQKRQRKRRKRPSRRPRPRSPRWVRWLTSLQACLRTKWPVRVLALPGRCKEQGAGMAHVS